MTHVHKAVLWGALGLLAAWIASNFARLTGDQDGLVRFVLGLLFAGLLLFRAKPSDQPGRPASAKTLLPAGMLGALLAVGGIVFRVHQFEWLGLILLLYACLRWALPASYGADIGRALLLLYWVHPLPGRVFGDMQLSMQQWSLAGAEWVLHAFNHRVWGDGLYLYTGFGVVGVPEACSGMRTAVTTLLSGLGIGLLYRFRWYELILLTALGLAQVLGLNVMRIAGVVTYAPKMPPEWRDNVLHDTLGLFLLVAILLVQLEAMIWQVVRLRLRRRREGIASAELERPERASRFPRFWQIVFRQARVLSGILLLALTVVAVVYKSRPYHRDEMRRGVIPGLMESDPDAAERAIAQALQRNPDDRGLLGQKIRVQVARRDFQGALATFETLAPPLSAFETTLKSWSLMALGRADEAVRLIDALPEPERQLPGVAIVRAEFAAIQGDPSVCAQHIVFAGKSVIEPARVRALFPFLARHEQWRAIVQADSDRPYRELGEALIAAHAGLRANDMDACARTLQQVVKVWRYDPRFLRYLFVLASRRPGSVWEDHFAASFAENYSRMDADTLVPYIAYCFQLPRPDLAWLAYLRLLALDPRDPDVFYTPAQFGNRWFGFRRHLIGVRGDDRTATIDLRPLAAHTRHLWPLNRIWTRLPLAKELSARDMGAARERYMKWTLGELEARERNGNLSRRGELIYPSVLAADKRFREAHARLDRIREKYPVFVSQVLLEHAQFYDQEKRWQPAYESLRDYYQATELIELPADLLMVNTLLNLNMAVHAVEIANRAGQTFPGVGYTDLMKAAIWDIFGYPDQALFTIGNHADDLFLQLAARMNAETGRIGEADKLYGALGLVLDRAAVGRNQYLIPPAAELALARRWPPTDPAGLAREGDRSRAAQTNATSPFVRDLEGLAAAWCANPEAPGVADPARWRASGRDAMERGVALHRLAALLGRQKRYEPATAAVRAALEEVPQSAVLHRMLVALTEGEPADIDAARRACPADPEIWLAALVARFRREGAGDWLLADCRAAAAGGLYSVDTLVRAGDFCLRHRQLPAAQALADAAIPAARGLIAAYMLGLRCALEARNAEAALNCAHLGVAHAADKGLFYRAIVQIKTIQQTPDADLLKALEYLNERFPKNPQWAQQLGSAYFETGDSTRALSILEPLLAQELSGVRVRSLLLAAEAARVTGYDTKAIDILERALAKHPEDMRVLNNLIYNLVLHPDSAPRARQLLPRLLAMDSESFAVLDTAAMVHLRNGDLAQAQQYMNRALSKLDDSNYSALEVRLNAAELLLRQGNLERAGDDLEAIRRDPRINNFLDIRARQLLDDVQRRQREDSGR